MIISCNCGCGKSSEYRMLDKFPSGKRIQEIFAAWGHPSFPTSVTFTCICGDTHTTGPAVEVDPIKAADISLAWFIMHRECKHSKQKQCAGKEVFRDNSD
jgi:hypothetical protein